MLGGLSLPGRASLVTAGCEAPGKAQGCPFHPGTTGEGKTGRVNASEALMMPRYRDPRMMEVGPGRRDIAVEKRQAAAGEQMSAV